MRTEVKTSKETRHVENVERVRIVIDDVIVCEIVKFHNYVEVSSIIDGKIVRQRITVDTEG